MVLRVKRAVSRLATRPEELSASGPETEASWQRKLNRLGLS
jgi:hypothetical protein